MHLSTVETRVKKWQSCCARQHDDQCLSFKCCLCVCVLELHHRAGVTSFTSWGCESFNFGLDNFVAESRAHSRACQHFEHSQLVANSDYLDYSYLDQLTWRSFPLLASVTSSKSGWAIDLSVTESISYYLFSRHNKKEPVL